MNNAISLGIRKQTSIPMTKDLKDEIINWRFLDSWTGKLEWKKERHLVVNIYTDASMYKLGGYFKINDREHKVGDSWAQEMLSLPIMVLEAKALLNVLRSIREDIKGSRVDANVDNQALIGAWNNEGSKSMILNSTLKDIFQLTLDLDVMLNLHFVPSKLNLADEPSRKLSKSDATLDNETWYKIQEYFGGNTGHTIDLMEQANASISVKQATPLMFSKLGKLCRHLSYRVSVEVDRISKFLYARDLAYFSILSHSDRRGGDLGLLTADRCLQMPDSDGIFVSQTADKVSTLDNPRNFIVLPSKDSDICPVKNFKKYITNAKELNITFMEGYVFRIRDKGSRTIVNEPVTSSCMTET
ncbi:unnamed protein product [Mytilus coruscus]|uniref:Uncharacterized protein n=1 Tax=Mytilus coruscus TaxID=42192 RepID=A0A6J8APD3_MYTCO|nr:unnamed protein product [Mytilus coruscus]